MRIPTHHVAAAFLCAALLAGCGAFQDPPEPTRLTAPPETWTETTAAGTPSFNDADSRFARQMIPLHEQALELAGLVPERSRNPEVRTLAEDVRVAREPQLEQLRVWLEEWGGQTGTDSADGAEPSTMQSPSGGEMVPLAEQTGSAFDRLWLEAMLTHLEAGVTVAETQLAEGRYRPSQRLAEELLSTHRSEIARVQAMLPD